MVLKVNPTRINLLSLKKELKIAEKGHKLLKDKRDGLMQRFMEVIHETHQLRRTADDELRTIFSLYVGGASFTTPTLLSGAFSHPHASLSLSVDTQSVMSVPIPQFSVTQEGSPFSYGYMDTNGNIDQALMRFSRLLPQLVKLAELEKTVENLAFEIERTRRRTSALENNRIPNLKETIRFINLRLEEQSRDAIVSAMRIKDMVTSNE